MTVKEACHHYAPMGMSMAAIAEVLDIERHAFYAIVKDEGLRHLFNPKNYSRDCKGGGYGIKKGFKHKYRPRVDGNLILQELKRYPDVSLFKTFADVHYSTVCRKFGCFSAIHKFALSSSPADPMWHYLAEVADGKRSLP